MKRLIPLGAAAALLVAAPDAPAAVGLAGGATQLTLDKATAAAIDSLGVRVQPTGRARARGARVTFPIVGGAIDPATAAGTIDHAGGLRLSGHGRAIVLRDYRVRVGTRIRLSARVGGARVPILVLTGQPAVRRDGFGTVVTELSAKLTAPAAHALNRTFGVHAFARGTTLGRVRLAAVPSQAEWRPVGATALALDPGTLQSLTALGVTPGVVEPATLTGTTASFPIAGGRADLDLGAGDVTHAGGISLTAGGTVVRLEAFDIRLGAAPQLLASVDGSAQKLAIADLDLRAATPAVDGRRVTVGNVAVRLTQGAADALNTAFGIPAIAAGLPLGVATVQASAR